MGLRHGLIPTRTIRQADNVQMSPEVPGSAVGRVVLRLEEREGFGAARRIPLWASKCSKALRQVL